MWWMPELSFVAFRWWFPLLCPLMDTANQPGRQCHPSYWLNLSVAESALIFSKEFRSAILQKRRGKGGSRERLICPTHPCDSEWKEKWF